MKKSKFFIFSLSLLITFSWLIACQKKNPLERAPSSRNPASEASPIPIDPKSVVAKINQTTITLGDFNEKYQQFVQVYGARMSKGDFLNQLIELEVGVQEAKNRGLENDSTLKNAFNTLLFRRLRYEAVTAKIEKLKISERMLRDFSRDNPEIRASHILFRVAPSASNEEKQAAKKKAEDILNKLKNNKASFAELAKQNSECPSAKNGGDLDYFTKEKMDPEFSKTAFNIKKVGDISSLVETVFGFHIIKLTGKKDYKDIDKDQLKDRFRRFKEQQDYDQFMKKLKDKAKIEIYTEKLN